jgi:cytoskeletal protein CcmA (bactofilin family)
MTLSIIGVIMFKKKEQSIKSLIAKGTRIEGTLTVLDGMRIDGEVLGDISCSSPNSLLVISETAIITGSISSDNIIVSGQVNGPIFSKTLLEINSSAKITGDIHYKGLEIHQGAKISGVLYPTLVNEPSMVKNKESSLTLSPFIESAVVA